MLNMFYLPEKPSLQIQNIVSPFNIPQAAPFLHKLSTPAGQALIGIVDTVVVIRVVVIRVVVIRVVVKVVVKVVVGKVVVIRDVSQIGPGIIIGF